TRSLILLLVIRGDSETVRSGRRFPGRGDAATLSPHHNRIDVVQVFETYGILAALPIVDDRAHGGAGHKRVLLGGESYDVAHPQRRCEPDGRAVRTDVDRICLEVCSDSIFVRDRNYDTGVQRNPWLFPLDRIHASHCGGSPPRRVPAG